MSSSGMTNRATHLARSSLNELSAWHDYSVSPEPLNGSYNLAYLITFEDSAQWIFKIPANSHHACFDRLAAESLTLSYHSISSTA